MREILFRGKDKRGYWHCGYYTTYIYANQYHAIQDENAVYTVISETVGQYTGLKDKNGTKIFEGDIIKINGLDGDYLFEVRFGKCGGAQNVVHEVGYIGFYLYPISKSAQKCENFGLRNDILYWLNRDDGIFVVGNIHDNPELIPSCQ